MRYLVYCKYIKVFRYIRGKELKEFAFDEKFGQRGKEAISILESRGGLVNCFPGWKKIML